MKPDYSRAARLAYKSLLALHIDSFPVDPLVVLSYCKNTHVRTYDEIASRFGISDPAHLKWYYLDNRDAYTVRQEKSGVTLYELIYDSHVNPYRRRFTLAHELGHIILNHRHEEWWEEQEADCFAAQLLAPKPVFPLFTSYGTDMTNPETVSGIFGLSHAASEIAARPTKQDADPDISAMLQAQFADHIARFCDRSAAI